MKRVSVVLAILLLATVSVARAEAPCSINTVRGTYAFELKGQGFWGDLLLPPYPPPVPPIPPVLPLLLGKALPIYFAGTMTVSGDGTAVGSYWGLFGMVAVGVDDPEPWSATVTVHPDCTGELTYPNAFGGTNVEKLVVLDNGLEIRTVSVADTPMPWQTTAVRISRTSGKVPMCDPSAARGRYVMRCDGMEGAPPPAYVGVAGMFVFEVAADGTMTGRHFGRGHPLEGYETGGTVTLKPDCTLKFTQWTDALPPGATILAKGVLYDNGREMFGAPLTVSLGHMDVPGFFGLGCHATRLTR
jgi:hypothetical protein